MLVLENIRHQYGNQTVLDSISFCLKPGQILCLTGPSGCGKTTLLRLIAGLCSATTGAIANQFHQTCYVFQEPRLLPWRTALENIAFSLKAKGLLKKQRLQKARILAEKLGIEDAVNLYPHQLSGGMQQRVSLGRALAVEPDLLLLDEPFNALDIGRRRDLQALLLKLIRESQKLAAILVSHDLAEAALLADKLVVLSPSPSRIVYQWKPDIKTSYRDDFYLYETVSELLNIPEITTCFGLNRK